MGSVGRARGPTERRPGRPPPPRRLCPFSRPLPPRPTPSQTLEKEREAASLAARPLPDFRAGDVLEARVAIPENRGRPATVRGVCIGRRRAGWRSSVRLLTAVPGGGVVERQIPL